MNDSRRSAQTSSVRNLQNLYSLVVGIALSYAVIQLTDAEQAPYVNTTALPLFFGFLVTLVPFYHGALRHLDSTYIESGGKDLRAGALLVDFAILFVEGCIFVALAKFLTAPVAFSWGLVTILAVDVAWAFGAHLAFSQNLPSKSEVTWAMINLVFGAILVAIIVTLQHAVPAERLEAVLSIVVPVVALVRTVFDYKMCWNFYYPTE